MTKTDRSPENREQNYMLDFIHDVMARWEKGKTQKINSQGEGKQDEKQNVEYYTDPVQQFPISKIIPRVTCSPRATHSPSTSFPLIPSIHSSHLPYSIIFPNQNIVISVIRRSVPWSTNVCSLFIIQACLLHVFHSHQSHPTVLVYLSSRLPPCSLYPYSFEDRYLDVVGRHHIPAYKKAIT